jgi:hypothetical protein
MPDPGRSLPPVQRDEGPLVRSFVTSFIQAAEVGSVGDLTGRPYERADLRELRDQLRYVESELGHLGVQEVRRADVQALVTRLTNEGMHPRGIAQVLESLSALFAYAWRLGLVEDSPVGGVSLPEEPRPVLDPAIDRARRQPPGTLGSMGASSSPYLPVSGYPTPPPPPMPGVDASFASFVAPPATPSTFGAMGFPAATGVAGTSVVPGTPGTQNAVYDATMQERWLWWTARIIVIVFVLIALVLAAESI